jgi:hypothetical protein
MSGDLYGAVIAGLIAIVERELAGELTGVSEAIGAWLFACALELRVAVVIRGDSTNLSAGIPESASGRVALVVTNTIPSVWPGEVIGAAASLH